MKKIMNLLGDLLFPPRCPICDETVPLWNQGICSDCLKKIKYVEPPRCCKCGKHILDNEAEYCEDCAKTTHYYLEGRALYEYKEASAGIYRFKYGGRQQYAKVFGEEMAFYLGDYIRSLKPDAFIPVPMYSGKVRRRGYNQAVLLARALGESLQIPVYDKMVKRIKNTEPMKLLNPEERLNNLKKAFILAENGVKLNTIIIVDDIYTTGSTIDAVARVLIAHGVKNVYFVTLAIGETIS